MELRDIEIFLTLAEELHFGRTATRLHLTPARISQSIKKQERNVGAELFARNSRNVRLTPVGEQLRNELAPVYRALQESVERARLSAKGTTQVLRIGMIPSNAHDMRPFWEEFRRRHPQWGLRIRHAPFMCPFDSVRNRDIDVLVTWLPVEEPDLTVGPVICTEPKLLILPWDHELAYRPSVSLEVLGDLPTTTTPIRPPDYWENEFTPFYTPSGRPIERGPQATTLDEIFTIISAGDGFSPIYAHVARYHIRPDIAFVPFHNGRRGRWAPVWRSDAETAPVRALAQVIRDLGTLEF